MAGLVVQSAVAAIRRCRPTSVSSNSDEILQRFPDKTEFSEEFVELSGSLTIQYQSFPLLKLGGFTIKECGLFNRLNYDRRVK
jgi:hypothetical protein